MIIRYTNIDSSGIPPKHKHAGDAGMDFFSIHDVRIPKHDFAVIHTGIRVELPEGHVGLLFPKGGNDHLLGAGVIDLYYEGEILFKVVNYFKHPVRIYKGDAVGQMIIVPFVEPEPVCFESLPSRSEQRKDSAGIKLSGLPVDMSALSMV